MSAAGGRPHRSQRRRTNGTGWRVGICLLACALAFPAGTVAQEDKQACRDDAMLVFDASKSMAASDADDAGLRRIDSVRSALARILPGVARKRRIGLVSYGPGPAEACANVTLDMTPQPYAAQRILERVNALEPDGRTPLTRAVRVAANALNFRQAPATIVLLTDGEETCKGDPCALARQLKAEGAGLTIHVISYRIADSIGSDGNFRARCLAEATGGLYVPATTAEEVADALKQALQCPLLSELRAAP